MTFTEFKTSISSQQEPKGMSQFLLALWHDARGNWDKAHTIIQDIENIDGAWVHAYLHRKEGDESNAKYWYKQAGKKFQAVSIEEEWEELVIYFLNQ